MYREGFWQYRPPYTDTRGGSMMPVQAVIQGHDPPKSVTFLEEKRRKGILEQIQQTSPPNNNNNTNTNQTLFHRISIKKEKEKKKETFGELNSKFNLSP